MPKVSVIVPVYKVERFLPRCLDSIINQTLKDIEIICVNDGSPDNSLQILEDYAKKDLRIKIINQENSGPSVSRNKGILMAQGEYIGFVDSDDWLDIDFYEKLYAAAQKYDADIAACGIKVYRKYSRVNYMLKYTKEHCVNDLERKLYLCDVPETCNVWNKIYRTTFIKNKNIKFEAGIHMQEDVSFTMEALYYSGNLVAVPATLYNYERRNENSIVRSKSLKKKQDVEYTQNKMFEFLKSNNINLPKTWRQVRKYKFLGITVLKVRYHSTRRECKLFNIIKFKLPPIYKYEEM